MLSPKLFRAQSQGDLSWLSGPRVGRLCRGRPLTPCRSPGNPDDLRGEEWRPFSAAVPVALPPLLLLLPATALLARLLDL